MRMLNRSLVLLSCSITLGLTAPAMAQLVPQASDMLPPTLDHSPSTRVEDPLLKEIETPSFNVQPQTPIVQVDKDTFQVSRIDVEGNAIISDERMRTIVAPYEGRELSPEDLASVVSKINEEYRVRGYLTSLAFVPPQDLERGAITIKVLEGMVGEMEVSGNKYLRAKVVERRINEKPGDPLNIPELEKELLRINRQEPYRLKATLSPGERTGETKLRLDVLEQQPFQIALTGDNQGRPYIGTYRGGIELIDRNVTGWGDRASVKYLVGAGQHIASAGYTLPIGKYGTEVSGLFGFSHVDVDLGVRNQPEILGNTYTYGFLLSQPLGKERTFVADLGLFAKRGSTFINGDKDSADDVRSATVGLNFNRYDRYGRTFARVSSSFAPDVLGANTSFWKAESQFTRITRLPKNNLLILRGHSQFSPDPLPPIEQFQLGGANTVRGYTEGLLLGDRGYSLSAEWRWPIPMLAKINPWLGERVQGAVFFDYGQTWMDRGNRNFVAGFSNTNKRTTLASAGFGVRAHLTDYMQGFADVAFGLLDRGDVEPNAQPTARVHFGVRSELLPNDFKSRTDTVTPIKTDVFRPRAVGALHQEDVQMDVADPTLEPMDHTMKRFKVY